MPDSGAVRRLTVTACTPMYSGNNKAGKPYTIYEVFAVDEGGEPVDAKLRSFDPLTLNQLVEYEITRRDDRQHGTSYTLKKPGRREPPPDPRALQLRINEQNQAIEALARRVTHAEEVVREIVDFLSGLESGGKPVPDVGELGSTAPASAALASNQDIRI